MDSNGTRFHLLLGRDDWARRCTDRTGATPLEPIFDASKAGGDADFSWDERRHELTLGSRVFHFVPSSGNRAVTLDARRGAAADVHGNIYWIDETGSEIRVHSSGSRATSHFWSSLDGCCETRVIPTERPLRVIPTERPLRVIPTERSEWRDPLPLFEDASPGKTPKPIPLAGLAVTTEHELVVGTTDPAGLLVFDLHRGGEPRQLLWPVPFTPFDIAATDDGGVWILDRQRACAWRLDRTMGVVPIGAAPPPPSEETFQSVDGDEPRCKPPASITSNMARTLTVTDAVAIEALPDDSILILDTPPLAKFSRIVRIHRDGTTHEASTEVAKSLVEESKRSEFTMRGHDFVAVIDVSSRPSEASGGTLYIAGSDGDQAVAFQLDPHGHGTADLHPLAELYPMRLFGARALIQSAGQPFYDADDRWVPLIAQKRVRYAREATLLIPELDGRTPDCVWHRLMLDACIPPECDVVVESRATNDPSLFELAPWSSEPRLLRRATGTELAWSHDLRDAGLETWELLFQRAAGRYLQLRITLRGNGRSSPHVRALRVWYPRFSYLERYLPAVYRENRESASFLDRFLANLEGFFTNIEDRIAAAQCLLDTRCSPAETLDWLAQWFEVALDPAWDEDKRRLFLRHAADFFEWRGTVPGLMMALRLVTEECADESIFEIAQSRRAGPRIVEKFRTRSLPAVLFGDTSDVSASGLPLRRVSERWEPAAGAAGLHQRWRAALKANEATTTFSLSGRDAVFYPIQAPSNRELRAFWIEFSRANLGFVPSATSADASLWQDILRRRYASLDALNREWQTTHASWTSIAPFTELPTRVAQLADWVHFEALVLPARAAAHRFSVFLPQSQLGLTDREKRIDLARRVIALEKPAHTTFDVKFYWAFFRVGEARLGEDTVVDRGSRSPELLSAFVLDRNYLGSGWIASELTRHSSAACDCSQPDKGGTR